MLTDEQKQKQVDTLVEELRRHYPDIPDHILRVATTDYILQRDETGNTSILPIVEKTANISIQGFVEQDPYEEEQDASWFFVALR